VVSWVDIERNANEETAIILWDHSFVTAWFERNWMGDLRLDDFLFVPPFLDLKSCHTDLTFSVTTF